MKAIVAKTYYSKPEIQKALIDFAKDREIGVMFDGYFGKRPDVMENLMDVKSLVDKGVFSFHMSEERWLNALLLSEKLTEDERDANRIGWDLILDLDGVDFEYARIVAKIILDFLEELGVKNKSIKFSGNKGFHIGVPFESFPQVMGGEPLTKRFPELPRKISAYLIHELKEKIAKAILERDGSVEKIAEKYKLDVNDLITEDESCYNLNFLKLIEIDTILIASRHLVRMPYSLHEKSSLVSVPVNPAKLMEFQRHWAKPNMVKPDYNRRFEFLKYDPAYGKDAYKLYEEVELFEGDPMIDSVVERQNSEKDNFGEFKFEINETIEIKDFPQTIQYVLNSDFEDGRKRAIFLLLTFLSSINWDWNHIEDTIYEWNKKQSDSLKENYIGAQISWFKNSSKEINPPNFDNDNYYKGINIPAEVVEKDKKAFRNREVKSPLHYVYLFLKGKNSQKGKKK